jgi:hypothetical protein
MVLRLRVVLGHDFWASEGTDRYLAMILRFRAVQGDNFGASEGIW